MDSFASTESILWLIWLGVGVVFILAELMIPGFIIVFFGIGALIAGATAYFGSSIPVQITVFGISSLLLLLVMRRFMASTFQGASSTDGSADEADSAIGALALVEEPITPPGRGRIKYQGTFWTAQAHQNIQAGATVRIVSRHANDPNTFTVEKEK